MRSSWKAAFGILLVFAFGCLSGALSTSVYFHQNLDLFLQRDPAAAADALQARLTRHLHLDAQQREQIHDVLVNYLQERRQLQARLQPDVQALNGEMIRQVRALLRPDQLPGFHENMLEFRRRLARAGVRPPGADAALADPVGATNAPPATAQPAVTH